MQSSENNLVAMPIDTVYLKQMCKSIPSSLGIAVSVLFSAETQKLSNFIKHFIV